VRLDSEHAEKLAILALRDDTSEEALAGLLLSRATAGTAAR